MTINEILINAWNDLGSIYKKGSICSERHLQSELFHLLKINKQFTESYQIFIEPKIFSKSEEFQKAKIHGIIPDLIITSEKSIICVMELKYVPTGYIPFQKDISNLIKFFDYRGTDGDIYLETNPISGDYNYEINYSISREILLVYGIIANESAFAITNHNEIWNYEKSEDKKMQNTMQLIGSVNRVNEAKFGLANEIYEIKSTNR